jgi:hypothetical protein
MLLAFAQAALIADKEDEVNKIDVDMRERGTLTAPMEGPISVSDNTVYRSRSGQIPHNRIDVQLGKVTAD